MRKLPVLIMTLWICLLSGCAAELETAAQTVETVLPVPSAAPAPVSMVITDESPEEILALGEYVSLRKIDATASREYDALLALSRALPECEIRWLYPLEGEMVPSDAEEIAVTDGGALAQALPYLPALRRVDATACDLTVQEMDALLEAYPQVDFLWNVRFGRWEVRSDITCFSTLGTDAVMRHRFTDQELYPLLRFCRHLRALDLGHNDLCDLSPIGELRELQVLILADNPRITDITPLGELTELRYLELFLDEEIRDFSPLERNTGMEDLNLCYCKYLDDADFIAAMPQLENAWMRFTRIREADLAPYADREINFVYDYDKSEMSSTAFGWRQTERNRAIRRAFSHWPGVEEFVSWDHVVYRPEGE